ncbi:hypothetical protein OLN68_19480, partial [Citrobacter freundii]|nr:hypothetical protein [Citrobacter freundii]MCW1447822.1 hypothetical protein [Citrobacter freundii]
MLFVIRVTGNVLPGEPGVLRFSGLNTGYNMMGWIKWYAASGSFHSLQTQKSPSGRMGFFTYLMPGSSLLSHGETPHYHRRYGVSLL